MLCFDPLFPFPFSLCCLFSFLACLSHQGEVLEEVHLGDAVGSVIGSGGSSVKTLQESTGAKIDIPRGSSSCRIYGNKDAVWILGISDKLVDASFFVWTPYTKVSRKGDGGIGGTVVRVCALATCDGAARDSKKKLWVVLVSFVGVCIFCVGVKPICSSSVLSAFNPSVFPVAYVQVAKAVEAIQKIVSRQAELNEKKKKYEEDKANQEANAQVVHMPDVCARNEILR